MARVGRRDKLTPRRQQTILGAIRTAGITYEEAALLAGISVRTFYRWQERAEAAAQVLPADWKKQSKSQLVEWMDELGIDESDVVPSGRRKRPVKRDYVSAIQATAGRYRDFFEDLKRAKIEGEIQTVVELRGIGRGWATDENGERRAVETVREHQVLRNGEWVTVSRTITQHPPNERVLRWILERRYARFGPKKAIDPGAGGAEPSAVAAQIHQALQEIEESFPSADP